MNVRGMLLALAATPAQELAGMGLPGSLCLLPAANRALGQHALEALQLAGVTAVTVVADARRVDEIRETLAEDGPAGLELEFVTAPAGASEGAAVRGAVAANGDDAYVVLAGHCLFAGDLTPLVESAARGDVAVGVLRDATVTPAIAAPARNLLADDASADGALGELARGLARVGQTPNLLPLEDVYVAAADARSLLGINRSALEAMRRDGLAVSSNGSELQGPVMIHPSAEVDGSLIRGPVVIGAGARVLDAYVGPYTAIAADATVENSEVEHSVIMRGAEIRHLGTRLEASIIGPRSQVKRSLAVPRALHLVLGSSATVLLD
jgi:glucose-1-phosphate thymidylyltransferase